jgi:hypothetical protein
MDSDEGFAADLVLRLNGTDLARYAHAEAIV